MNGIKILGTGRGVPSKLVTNEDMAKICLLYTSTIFTDMPMSMSWEAR